MKIAIPSLEQVPESLISPYFGRTNYFLIYDDEEDSFTALPTLELPSAENAGIKAAQLLLDNNVQVVLTISCGLNAVRLLNAGNIEIYSAQQGSVLESVRLFREGKLGPLVKLRIGFGAPDA